MKGVCSDAVQGGIWSASVCSRGLSVGEVITLLLKLSKMSDFKFVQRIKYIKIR